MELFAQPGGLVFYEVLKALFPDGHPYQHSVIGSMADLDAASMADVRQWFVDNYGPNNAVLVLAGDITPAEARPLVQKYFGNIKRGPVNVPASAAIPTLKAPKSMVMKDRVAATQVSRYWPMPGLLDRRWLRSIRRIGDRRTRQFAARQDPGARREDRDFGLGRPYPFQGSAFSSPGDVKPASTPLSSVGSIRFWPTISPAARPRRSAAPPPPKSRSVFAGLNRSAVSAERR